MCGIVGYIGTNTRKNLIDLLKKLEYRGYDSAGIATLSLGKIKIVKSVGNISNLKKIVDFNIKDKIGIAHTRWATHGKPTLNNTHPHISNDGVWAVVHNGIIENYSELKLKLKKFGFSFYGDTDSEVIGNLFQLNNQNSKIQTIIKSCNLLKGSFALCCINSSCKNTLFLAKNKCPLYVAKGNNALIVASDPICFEEKMTEYYSLEDFEFCEASVKKLVFYDEFGKKILKKPIKIDNFSTSNNKGNYKHYMLKEIYEIPSVLKNITKTYSKSNIFDYFNKEKICQYKKIVLIGCGTAYHASLLGARYIEKFTRVDAHAYIASEFRYKKPRIDKNTLVIMVSQSGETADTIAVCELAKAKGSTTIAVTNVRYSSLAKMADIVLPVCAGPEIAVASTKAYIGQISILYLFSKHLEKTLYGNKNTTNKFFEFAEAYHLFNEEVLNELVQKLKSSQKAFFIGRDLDYITCLESSLKLKEITYINSSAYPAGELKHGFLALIDDQSYVFVFATQKKLLEKTLNGANEALSRGGKIILITQFEIPKSKTKDFYKIIKLEKYEEELMPFSSIVIGQMLAYKTSTAKNLNPDQPRNLAKSVTVE